MSQQRIIILTIVSIAGFIGLIILQASYLQNAISLKKSNFDFSVNRALDNMMINIDKDYQSYHRRITSSGSESFKSAYSSFLSDIHVPEVDESQSQFMRNTAGLNSSLAKYRNAIHRKQATRKEELDQEKINFEKLDHERTFNLYINNIDIYQLTSDYLRNNGIFSDFEIGIKEYDNFIFSTPNFFYYTSEYTYSKRIFFDGKNGLGTFYFIFAEQAEDNSSLWLALPSIIITFIIAVCFYIGLSAIIRQKKISIIKNDFINNITHEFKTPIATISLASQMLKENAVAQTPESTMRIAGIIGDESKRLTNQVEKVLQMALFSETRMKLKRKEIHMNELVESMADKFRFRIEDEKHGSVHCRLKAVDDCVLADEVHITNVISNLMDNAIKYCDKEPIISIYTSNKENNLIINVMDNGIGIAYKDQKLIFERFYRVSTGNLHDVKGFGLGLSYVKMIIEAHGGSINVESTLGKGSRFDIILPLMRKKPKANRTLFS